MMAAYRTETARHPHPGGLIFDWKTHRTPRFTKLCLLALATGVFLLPLAVVRVNVGTPPVQNARSASMMVLTPENDPMHWREKARDLGPFPTRFDPTDWRASHDGVEQVLAGIRARSLPEYVPRFEGLPGDGPPPRVPLVVKGSRHLPPVAAPAFPPIDTARVRAMPLLYPLSMARGNLPENIPPFDVEVSPEMASLPWRFLLQVAPDGAVLHAVALIGHNAPGRAELTRWLQAHRFAPLTAATGQRWVAVAVTFQNILPDGSDDS